MRRGRKCTQLKKSLCLYDEAALYLTGEFGTAEDYPKGLALAVQAADLGERAAGWGLAKLYLMGDYGLQVDIPKAMAMLRALSEQGYGLAACGPLHPAKTMLR